MGRIHTHTRPYVQRSCMEEGLDWRHSYLFWPENNQWVDPDIQPLWEQTLAEMEALPRSCEDYGIVHTDIHHLNYHVNGGIITLFDFDDCAYGYYAYDIASTLFFMAGTGDYRDAHSGTAILKQCCGPLLRGYRTQAELPAHWIDWFLLFLRYRRLAQCRFFTNLFRGQNGPYKEYLAWSKSDILSGFPYLQHDFAGSLT